MGLDLKKMIDAGEIDTVVVAFPDHYGRLMGKRVPAGYFDELIAEGELHACDYLMTADMELEPLPGFAFASWDTGYGDMALRPDLSTLRLTPWLPGSANGLEGNGKVIGSGGISSQSHNYFSYRGVISLDR